MSSYWKIGAFVLGASLLFTGPSFASSNESEEETAAEQSDDDMICRRVHVTGTRIPQRMCFTRSDWSDMREEARETIDDAVADSNTVHSNE